MSCGGGAPAETYGSWITTETKMMDILIYSLIKLRQSDTEHSPLARQAIKRLEKQEKQQQTYLNKQQLIKIYKQHLLLYSPQQVLELRMINS